MFSNSPKLIITREQRAKELNSVWRSVVSG